MREIQYLVIPKDNTKKPKNMTMEQMKSLFKKEENEIIEYLESGDELNGYFIDDAIIYDSKLS